jgi:hypothetical protein
MVKAWLAPSGEGVYYKIAVRVGGGGGEGMLDSSRSTQREMYWEGEDFSL